MSNSQPSLDDLKSILKAAEEESNLLKEPEQKKNNESATIIGGAKLNNVSVSDIKDTLNNTNVSNIINQMNSNPSDLNKIMEQSMGKMSPEMMEQARKMASSGQGEQIIREMQKRGLDPQQIRSQFMEQRKILKGMGGNDLSEKSQQVIVITHNRQLKVRKLTVSNLKLSIDTILKTSDGVELSCSRLATGPLAGKTIKIWYDPNYPGLNKRAKKLLGFPVGGDIIILMSEGDISEKDFLICEKKLE